MTTLLRYLPHAIITAALTYTGILLYPHKAPLSQSIVKVMNFEGTGGGTGFSVKSNGRNVIVTNSHVCEVAYRNFAIIEQDSGKQSIKQIISRVPERDLCVLEGVDAPALPIAKSGPTRFQKINIIGHPLLKPTSHAEGEYVADTIVPLGLQAEADGTCKTGRQEASPFGTFCVVDMELSFTTIPVYPGNSGSPVLNADGEVIGVINAAGPDDRGLFIPLPYLKEILGQEN